MDRRQFLTGFGLTTTMGLAGCGAPTAEESPTPTGEVTDTPASTEISMVTEGSEYYFDPIGLFVEPGTTITWVNEAGAHSATAYAEGNGGASVTRIPPDADPWNSGILSAEGATFDHTVAVPGTYDYFCIPHKTLGMVGRLVVGDPGGVEGDPPDGPVPSPQRIVEAGAVGWDEFQGG